jgi:hypothetical protein
MRESNRFSPPALGYRTNERLVNAELCSKVLQWYASFSGCNDGCKRVNGDFCVPVFVAKRKAVALNGILHILRMRTSKQVSGIHTFGVVA